MTELSVLLEKSWFVLKRNRKAFRIFLVEMPAIIIIDLGNFYREAMSNLSISKSCDMFEVKAE